MEQRKSKEIRGYKVFHPDWTGKNGFQYKVGETYEENVTLKVRKRGFHFCVKLADCFGYYKFDPNNKVAEVTALGVVTSDGNLSCTDKLRIDRELTWREVLEFVNTGRECTGLGNSGNWNSGNWNSGDWNSGHYNSGNWNNGNRNNGDWNSGDRNSGCFNTMEPTLLMFNRPSDWTYRTWTDSKARSLLSNIPAKSLRWVDSANMTEEEKAEHPEHETVGGYLKAVDETEKRQDWWDCLSDADKEAVYSLPNFDSDVFQEITGIKTAFQPTTHLDSSKENIHEKILIEICKEEKRTAEELKEAVLKALNDPNCPVWLYILYSYMLKLDNR